MSFCEDGPADHVPLVNQEYCFEELVEEGGRGGEGGLGCVEGKGKESEEGEEGEGEGEEEDSDDVEKKITYHHEKRSWSTSSVESPMRTGITLKPNNRRSMGPPGGRGGGGGEGSNVIDWGAWEEGGGNNNCAVIGRENLDLLAWSAKAWNRRAEGRDSQRWGKKVYRDFSLCACYFHFIYHSPFLSHRILVSLFKKLNHWSQKNLVLNHLALVPRTAVQVYKEDEDI